MAEHTTIPVPQALPLDEEGAFLDAMEHLCAIGAENIVRRIRDALQRSDAWTDVITLTVLCDVAIADRSPAAAF